MRGWIEWMEVDVARARKVMLFGIVIAVLVMALLVEMCVALGVDMSGFEGYFEQLSYLAMAAVVFYTGTTPGKPLLNFGGKNEKAP